MSVARRPASVTRPALVSVCCRKRRFVISGSMGRVVVRRATPGDYDGVVRISKDIYDGRDILPDVYFKYLEDPTRRAVVAEIDGQIVAFEVAHIVDAGRTAVVQARRASSTIRGSGIFRLLEQRAFREIIFPTFPRVSRLRSSSIDTEYWDSKTDGTNIITRRVVISLGGVPVPCADFVRRLTPQRMAALRRHLPIDSLSPANGNTLNDILADPISRKHLFPDGIMVRDVDVFDAHASNTHLVTQACSAILVSGKASLMYESLSFGHVAECQLGRRYTIDYYGTRDHSVILAHVSRHLPLVPEISRERPLLLHLIVQEACMGEETKQHINKFAAANIASVGQRPRYFKIYTMTHPLPVPNPKL